MLPSVDIQILWRQKEVPNKESPDDVIWQAWGRSVTNKRDNASKNLMLSDQAFVNISKHSDYDSVKERVHLPTEKCSSKKCLYHLTNREDKLISKKNRMKTRITNSNSGRQRGNFFRDDLKLKVTNSSLRDKYMLRDSSSGTEKRLLKYSLLSKRQKNLLRSASGGVSGASVSRIPSTLLSEGKKRMLRGASAFKTPGKTRRDLSPLSARTDSGVTFQPITDEIVDSTDKIVPRFSTGNIADIDSDPWQVNSSYDTGKRGASNISDNKGDVSSRTSSKYEGGSSQPKYENLHFRKKRRKWESDDSVKNKHTILEKSKTEPPVGKLEPVGGWYDVRATASLELANFQLDSEEYSSSDPEDPFLLEREHLLECELWLPGTDFSSKQSTLYIPGR